MAATPAEVQSVDIDPINEKRQRETIHEKEAAPRSGSSYGAEKIWTLYNVKADKHDTVLVARLKGSMDSILVFAGLFSAVVTAFIIESYKLLSMGSDDTTVFYLAQITQQLATISQNNPTLPPMAPLAFEPTPSDVAVNVLWILSLIFSLACALGATLVQTWTSRYMRIVDQSPDVVTRARDRAWHFDGLEKSQMAHFADGVPALLHVSLFLFLAGLVVFFFPINHQVARATMGASIACAAIYLIFAILHLMVPNSPYRTPFSVLLAGILLTGLSLALGALILGLGLAILGVIIAITLVIFVLSLPCLPFALCCGSRNKTASEWGKAAQSRAPRVTDQNWDKYRKHARSSHLYSRIRGTPISKPKQDAKALRWLLEKMTTVPELEQFIEGIEPFIERSPDQAVYAGLVLDLGGDSVGSFAAELGVCVGQLLESCVLPQAADLPLKLRRSRAIAATRAIVSVFAHSGTEGRVNLITEDEPPALIQELFELEDDDIGTIRWEQWVNEIVWETITTLRVDTDPVISFHASCLSILLIHRALSDLASRMKSREVQINAPAHWNLQMLISALQKVRRFELYELIVAIQLIPSLEDAPTGFGIVPGYPEGAPPRGKTRPILVTFKHEGATADEPAPEIAFVSHTTFQNEALLMNLSSLLDYLSTSSIRLSASYSDLLTRTFRAIAKDGSAEGTSVDMQRHFVNSLRRLYTTHGIMEERRVSTSIMVSSSRFTTLRSVLQSKETIAFLVPIVESLDEPERSIAFQSLPQDLRVRQSVDVSGAVTGRPSADEELSSIKEEVQEGVESVAPELASSG